MLLHNVPIQKFQDLITNIQELNSVHSRTGSSMGVAFQIEGNDTDINRIKKYDALDQLIIPINYWIVNLIQIYVPVEA